MSKQLSTIGYTIPTFEENEINLYGNPSLMDTDVLLISPGSLYPSGDWVNFSNSDGGCYNVGASQRYKEKISHLKKEMQDHLNSGKNIFLLLSEQEKYQLASSVSTPKKGAASYATETASNYGFLPASIGTLTSASGKHINFSGNSLFSDFYNKFKENLTYKLYTQSIENAEIVFTGKDKTKILGAIYKVGKGYLITLPFITFKESDFTETKKTEDGQEKEFWNKKGTAFGNNLLRCLLDIDRKLIGDSEKTLSPDWVLKKKFLGKKEEKITNLVDINNKKIEKIKELNKNLKEQLVEEAQLRDLLFEQGKPLEKAVTKALKILGYQAENYDDGELEMDQVILSPERIRYIGECEGKDSKDINITKFRQLVDALNADFVREEVETKAFGILFGNSERLKEPEKRTLDFTTKCKSGAQREKIALVKTSDLFQVAKYLNENKNETFKKACRSAIHDNLGTIVNFPSIPKIVSK